MFATRFIKLWVGGAILLALFVCGVGAPWLAPHDPQAQTLQSWYQTGYGGEVPSRVWGSVGGNMVRRMIAAAQQSMIQQATQQTQAAFRQALGQPLGPTGYPQQSHTQSYTHQTQTAQQLSTNPFQVQIPPAN